MPRPRVASGPPASLSVSFFPVVCPRVGPLESSRSLRSRLPSFNYVPFSLSFSLVLRGFMTNENVPRTHEPLLRAGLWNIRVLSTVARGPPHSRTRNSCKQQSCAATRTLSLPRTRRTRSAEFTLTFLCDTLISDSSVVSSVCECSIDALWARTEPLRQTLSTTERTGV